MPVVELSISGNDKQKITEQNDNLLIFKNGEQEINGVTVSFENGVITLNGTAINIINLDIPIKDLLKTDTYRCTISQISGSRSDNVGFLLRDSNTDENLITINGSGGTTYVLENNTYCYLRIYIPKNNQISNLVYKCMLSKGEEAKEWVEGIPNSPSPSYPSEVETVNTQANIIICSNNLYDNKDMMDFDCKYEEDDYIKCEYDNTSGTSTIFKNFFTNASKLIKPNKDYWVVLEIKEVKGTGKIQTLSNASVVQFNNWQDYNFSSLTAGKILIRKVASSANSDNATMFLRSYCQFLAGESGSITFRISVSPNEVTAENFKYVSHLEQTKTVDIQQPMLFGDYFIKEEDGWKEVQTWGKYVFTGNENFSFGNAYQDKYRRFSMAYDESLNVKKASWNEIGAKSNYFTGIANKNYETAQNNVWINEQSRFNIGIDTAYLTEDSANGLKAWLAQKHTEGNPVYVWYKLATPTKLACTEKQSAQLEDLLNTSTYKNVTHIYSTDKVSPIIKVVYRKDLETMLNSQKNDYDTRLSNIEKLLTTTTTSALLLDNLQTDLEKEVL